MSFILLFTDDLVIYTGALKQLKEINLVKNTALIAKIFLFLFLRHGETATFLKKAQISDIYLVIFLIYS